MLHFTSTPPEKSSGSGLRLLRTPSPGKLIAVVTSDDLVGCPTHFYNKRTVPCTPPDCPACAASYPWRWHGYLSASDLKTHEHFLFEMTAQAVEPLTLYRQRHHTLRGCMFEASRLGLHANGRVVIRCKPVDLTQVDLPKSPDLIACLCHIWNVPTTQVYEEGRLKEIPRLRVAEKEKGNNEPITETQPVT